MKKLRNWVPILGLLALAAMFLKLPQVPNIHGIFACKTCTAQDPYLPLVGAGYFALLVAVSMLFSAFPGRQMARSGLVWAVLLAAVLTYMSWPGWCAACLIAHICHILMWTIWVVVPPGRKKSKASGFKERLCVTIVAPISVMALFSSLNLSFMAYGFKIKHHVPSASLQLGDALPVFASVEGVQTIINFIAPDCPYCREQMEILNPIMTELAGRSYRFINISPALPSELDQNSPIEWIEDKQGMLREQFKVVGFPTLFVASSDGKITRVISGVPDELKTSLLTSLAKQIN